MKRLLRAGLLAVLAATSAQALDIGQSLPAIALADQFGKPQDITLATRRVYFTHDMAGGKLLKAALGEQGQAVLDAQQALAIADVSGMPSVIRNTMALPAMKKRSYRIGIDVEGKAVAMLPRQPDAVTVIELNQLTVTAVQYFVDDKALAAAVQSAAAGK